MTEYERNELIRFIESITFYAPKDGKPSWIKPAFDMIKEVIINKIDDIYNENEMREIDIHRKSYKELQQTVTDLSLENCLLKKKVEEMKWIPVSESLPKSNQIVLVTEDGEVKLCTYELWYGYGYGFYGSRGNVTAWMPLPKAYEGQKND